MPIPTCIVHIIAEYAAQWIIARWMRDIESRMEREYINVHSDRRNPQSWYEFKLGQLLGNPMAMDMFHGVDLSKVSLDFLCGNPADWALDIIEANLHKINLSALSVNPNPRAIAILLKNVNKINWITFSQNPGAIAILRQNPEKIDPQFIMINESPDTPDLIRDQGILIDKYWISGNSAEWAVNILRTSKISISKSWLAMNKHSWAIDQLAAVNPDSLAWHVLCLNPSAINIIRKSPERITDYIWTNPAIFEPIIENGLEEIIWTIL